MTTEEAQKSNEDPKEENKIIEEKDSLDFKALYYSQPSQKDKIKKDFTEYADVDIALLNKKREREKEEQKEESKENNEKIEDDNNNDIKEIKEEKNLDKEKKEENDNNKEINKDEKKEDNNNINKEEEIKENDLENNLPKELLDLIEERKNNEPFTAEDFEKYRAYKKINVNFHK